VGGMNLTIHNTFLPADDPEASLGFWRDTMGFEVRNDVGYGDMRWITVGPPGQPQTSIVLHPPAVDPGLTDDEKRTIAELMAKGSYASIVLSSTDVDEAFEQVQKNGADVVQEPMDQPYGLRDCAFRDPAGNMVRINQAI
jgi:predicted enzyme related to lactoylglutathione lyase